MPVHLLHLESAPGLVERAHQTLAAERLAREHGAHASAALGSVLAPLPVAQPGDPR
ncbi:MAG: hypothetical protein ABI696_14240 [Rubrivivax sp.]